MNKILLLLLCLTTLTCSSKTEKPIPEKQLEGWAGNPDNPNEKPFDYFYMKFTGRASQAWGSHIEGIKAIKSTCLEAIFFKGKHDLIRKMVNEPFESFYFRFTISDVESLKSVLHSEYSGIIKQIGTKDCKPLAPSDSKFPYREWKECECIIYSHIPGGKDGIIARARELDRE